MVGRGKAREWVNRFGFRKNVAYAAQSGSSVVKGSQMQGEKQKTGEAEMGAGNSKKLWLAFGGLAVLLLLILNIVWTQVGNRFEAMQSQLQQANEATKAAQQRNQQLSATVADLQERISALDSTVTQTGNLTQSTANTAETLTNELAGLRGQLQSVNSEMASLQQRLSVFDGKIEDTAGVTERHEAFLRQDLERNRKTLELLRSVIAAEERILSGGSSK
ncbi:MAG: hypothetical protein K9L28_00430 [Synergistales bacterium]|nr:hypothetical protein [Synergistales bacterium]